MSSTVQRHPFRSAIVDRLRPLILALAGLAVTTGGAGPVIALAPDAGSMPVASIHAPSAPPAFEPAPSKSSTLEAVRGYLPGATSPLVPTGPALAVGATLGGGASIPAGPRQFRATVGVRAPGASPAPTPFAGRNHVWIPALGIDRSISSFPCSRSTAPANYVYRWGCAGANNVYLLGHAYGVFKPLHDAYYNGRLRVGLEVVYADGSGAVHTYRVQYWKVVRPTTSASWAWAALSTPGMTLQTCLGADSEYRLMVRLTRVD